MFENRSEKELIVIYVVIALLVTFALGVFHYYTWSGVFREPAILIILGNIEFFVIFYVLYLPIKVKNKTKQKQPKKK